MEINRYHRQMLLPQIGPAGQARLAQARVLLVGCGALGTGIADQLVRAGVGFIRIADRDIVELTNLQRQVLFDEEDVRQGLPKAVAAAQRLQRINSQVQIEPQVVDVHGGNIEELAGLDSKTPVNLILDGTDNVETRYLVNDLCVKHGLPWIYGACVGTEGRVMAIRPGAGPCLRCIFPEPPRPAELATCDTAGVLGPAASVVASLQATLAIQMLVGAEVAEQMLTLDLWPIRFHAISTKDAKREDCRCCGQRRFEFLSSIAGPGTTSLCGRNAVQIRPAQNGHRIDLAAMATRLAAVGEVQSSPYFIRCQVKDQQGITLTLFPDARVIVQGTSDSARARSLAARFLGV